MKIGVFGVGHLGKIHIKCLLETDFEISGFFDPDDRAAEFVINEFGIKRFESPDELISVSDCIDIVSPTVYHYDLAKKAALAGRHIFIEKPVTETPEQAFELWQLAKEKSVRIQVGHVERYNPAFIALKSEFLKPGFIEGHRLAVFNPRGTDVSVVLDLMIHDLDMVLSIVRSEVVNIHANGVCVVSTTPDICNARIEFKNGCIVNLTASRISMKNMRKLRLFQKDAYISIDFLAKEAQIIKIEDLPLGEDFSGMTIQTNSGNKRIIIDTPAKLNNNAIKDELQDFHDSVISGDPISVGIEAGYKALKLAYDILKKIEETKYDE
ncbi:MAG: Gfo/Idh/MocA family oxidoreductase [Saprospiraceae bacterium]|nr:Gfo/Idh/MocA family oxidoreductase [Saprospiraceae bacterium]